MSSTSSTSSLSSPIQQQQQQQISGIVTRIQEETTPTVATTKQRNSSMNEFFEKINKTRYFNLKRSGTIICRTCNLKSKTPTEHIKHVNMKHEHLEKFCPFCQRINICDILTGERLRQSTRHLKLCCYMSKIENSDKRQIFNRILNNRPENSSTTTVTTSTILTRQCLEYDCDIKYCLHVLEYGYQNHAASAAAVSSSAVAATTTITTTIIDALNSTNSNAPAHQSQMHIPSAASIIQCSNISPTPSTSSPPPLLLQHAQPPPPLPSSSSSQQFFYETTSLLQTETIFTPFSSIAETLDFVHKYLIKAIHPIWWKSNIEILSPVEQMIARNRFEFHSEENIDCQMARIMSLQFEKFKCYQVTVNGQIFVEFFNLLLHYQNIQEIYVLRYIRLITKTNFAYSDEKLISVILILQNNQRDTHVINDIISLKQYAGQIYIDAIHSFDQLIKICIHLSNIKDKMKYPSRKRFKLFNLSFGSDILKQQQQQPLQQQSINDIHHVYTHRNSNDNDYINTHHFKEFISNSNDQTIKYYYLSSMNDYANILFYSQTYYGCMRAFDNMLRESNLVGLMDQVVLNQQKFVIYYSSIKESMKLQIRLPRGKRFAVEKDYRQMNFIESIKIDDLFDKCLFLLDINNLKLTVNDDDDVGVGEMESEITYLPECLSVTNLHYKLSDEQIEIYKIVQYHREKILLEMNSICNIGI